MSDAPGELWVSPGEGEYEGLWVEDGPGEDDEVRYVRGDLVTDEEYARYSPWQQQRGMTPEEARRWVEAYDARGQGLRQAAPPVHYGLRLSEEDVQRIAEAVVAGLRGRQRR
jgi:hypothetical protein